MSTDYGQCNPVNAPDKEQDPSDARTHTISWVDRIKNETISTSSWTYESCTGASESNTDNTTSAVISGISEGVLAKAKNTVTTSGGQTFSKTLRVVGRVQ